MFGLVFSTSATNEIFLVQLLLMFINHTFMSFRVIIASNSCTLFASQPHPSHCLSWSYNSGGFRGGSRGSLEPPK